jgi:hypothetical protein
MAFAHEVVCRVTGLRGDHAALGGAVTVALCGHWEHDGPCRWPHHTATADDGDEVVVTVRFDAPADDVAVVSRRVHEALTAGTLTGPDGVTASWHTVAC